MDYIFEGLRQAFHLIFSGDSELYHIIFLTLYVTIIATIIGTVIAVPIGLLIATHEFPLKGFISKVSYTLMGLPPVVLGLFVFLLLSRSGPFGYLSLAFTPTAMIIAQVLLVIPIILSLVLTNTSAMTQDIMSTCKTLGASRFHTLWKIITEAKPYIFVAIISGFSRAISEVGAVMIVGGNIKGFTRVMTTYIALMREDGRYQEAIAMGIVLISISFVINSIAYRFTIGGKNGKKH